MPALPYSPWLLAALVIAALAIAVVLLWKRSAPAASNSKPRNYRLEDWNPRTMRPLTHAELRMMLHLRKALPECLLLPQIALARFMNVNQNKSYNQWFGSVGRRCVDFLVCSEQGDVLGVIQLNNPKSKNHRPLQRARNASFIRWKRRKFPFGKLPMTHCQMLPICAKWCCLNWKPRMSIPFSMQHHQNQCGRLRSLSLAAPHQHLSLRQPQPLKQRPFAKPSQPRQTAGIKLGRARRLAQANFSMSLA
ncbi:MAG: DUF2726 domain-containing protein [Brachymonas sp.]|nr:DUF2726 domain-containing protein [Brachymonas sp.]